MKPVNRTRTSSTLHRLAAGAAVVAALSLTGCGAGLAGKDLAPVTAAGTAMQGSVHGGQQPVSGAAIQLYAANLTGYGTASTPLLTTVVTTNTTGGFTVTGDYTCPSATASVYIVATGGDPGGGVNSGLALMAALGACGNLTASTNVNINELTTVAAAYALSPFMTSPAQLATSAGNGTGLNIAFSSATRLVNNTTGAMPGSTLPVGASEPAAELNTLADILAACVNSATGSSTCASLYTDATPSGGTAPADTITAILNIARNPSNNAAALYNTVPPAAPFLPTLTSAPTDFTVSIKYMPVVGAFSTPSAAAVDASGNLWVTNAGNNTITVLNATTAASSAYVGGGLSAPSAIAFDLAGNAWVADKGSSMLSVFTPAGVGTQSTATGLSAPTGVAIDGQGIVWVTNAGNSSVTANTVSGTSVNASTSYSTGGVNAPVGIAIDPH